MNADQLARRVAETLWAREGTGPAWGIVIDDVRVGYARVHMKVRPDMLNGFGSIHGAMIFALADTAFAYACNAGNVTTVAAQASIAFLGGVTAGETLVAEATERARAGRSGVCQVSVVSETGRKIAEFQGLSRSLGGPIVKTDRDASGGRE